MFVKYSHLENFLEKCLIPSKEVGLRNHGNHVKIGNELKFSKLFVRTYLGKLATYLL